MTLLILGLVVSFVSSGLTIFSIFYDYNKEKPVKITKWGRIAVAVSVILLLVNGVIQYIDYKNAKEQQKYAAEKEQDAVLKTNNLISQNDSLLFIIKNLSSLSSLNFKTINDDLEQNINKLENVKTSMNSVWNSMTDMRYQISEISIVINYDFGTILKNYERELYNNLQKKYGEKSKDIVEKMISDYTKIYNVEPWIPQEIKFYSSYGESIGNPIKADSIPINWHDDYPNYNFDVSGTFNGNQISCKSLRCISEEEMMIMIFYDYIKFYKVIFDTTDLYVTSDILKQIDREYYKQHRDIFEDVFNSEMFLLNINYLNLIISAPEPYTITFYNFARLNYQKYETVNDRMLVRMQIRITQNELNQLIAKKKLLIKR